MDLLFFRFFHGEYFFFETFYVQLITDKHYTSGAENFLPHLPEP